MTAINPIKINNTPPLTYEAIEQMDDNSIWTKFDTDNSGTITDKEIKALGFVKNAFYEIKEYLTNRFGTKKITNVEPGENYFDYQTENADIKIANTIEDIPKGSHEGIRDARGYDISNLELSKDELLNLCINKTTVLSSEQKAIVDIYTEKMKDPGLGIRNLHKQGITGKGVKMAIIDQPLGKHQEYSDNISNMTDINSVKMGWGNASMHGAAVTSIAVGKNIGVAPEAQVDYYSAVNFTTDPDDIEVYKSNLKKEIENNKNNSEYVQFLQNELENINPEQGVSSNQPYVDALNQILNKNETIPENERISVVSISWGFDEFAPGYEELQHTLARAKEQGVFIVSTALDKHYGMNTCGANRNPQTDQNDPESYEAGAFFKEQSESESWQQGGWTNQLLVPMDHRTVADFTDEESYRYEGNDGGMSWSTPWLAATYALAKQVKPDITPEQFWQTAMDTSDECRNNDTGTYVARLINPQRLIDKIKE